MNTVIEQLKSHRSVRKYKEKTISSEVLDQILEAATMASSSGNMQAYSIIVTEDEKMKEKMFKAHFEQSMLMEAPVFLTFCADFNRMRRWLKIRDAANNFDNFMSFMIGSIDAILASQNAAIAAESLGLGICYMGTTLASSTELSEILELPENVIPVVGFSLGYPDELPEKRKRLPIEGIIHKEKYQQYPFYEIAKIYEEKEREGMKRYQDVGIENLAKVYTEYKYTEESHIKYSKDLLGLLEKQRFLN
ncbi:MAG: NADPH-dependent oxidoreductase [Oligoflexia bacterium]|nr:NADPH-dependent oxidoreductase [Oligoflexia bacterium]